MMSNNNIENSKKYGQVKKFKKLKPHIVNIDWLYDCFEQGIVKNVEGEDGEMYLFKPI